MRIRLRLPAREVVRPTPGGVFSTLRSRPSHWGFAWHHYPELELTWIVRGEGVRHVGHAVESFRSGDLTLLGPGLPHTWVSERRPGRTVEAVVVQFPAEVFGPRWRAVAELRAVAVLCDAAAQGLVFRGATALHPHLDALVALGPGPCRVGALLDVLGRLAVLPHRILLLDPRRAQRRLTRDDDRWARLASGLAAHPVAAPSQAEAARRFGMEPSVFARAFRRRHRTSYGVLRTRLRLEHACRALAEGGDGVLAIALAAGFGSLSAFNRSFRTAYGLSPGVWRRRAQA